MLLLILVSVSAPVTTISFLDAEINGKSIHFGEYGYTGSKRSIGYAINETALGLPDKLLNVPIVSSLTKALVLHTVAACLLFVALLQGTCSMLNDSRIHTTLMGITMILALIFVIIAFAVDMILFSLVGERIRADGYSAHLSSATWMTLSALVIIFMGICAAGLGAICGYYDDEYDDSDRRYSYYYRRRRRY